MLPDKYADWEAALIAAALNDDRDGPTKYCVRTVSPDGKPVRSIGGFLYGLVYLGFALFTDKAFLIVLFAAYGAYNALISGAERAFIAESSPAEYRGTVLGIYGMLQGIGLLLASIIAGLLWDNINSSAPFWLGGIFGLASAAAISLILGTRKKPV